MRRVGCHVRVQGSVVCMYESLSDLGFAACSRAVDAGGHRSTILKCASNGRGMDHQSVNRQEEGSKDLRID